MCISIGQNCKYSRSYACKQDVLYSCAMLECIYLVAKPVEHLPQGGN